MTSRRQRHQPNHHIGCYTYPPAALDDDFYGVTDETLVGVPSSLNLEVAHDKIFDLHPHIDSHFRDFSTVASSSSVPSLRSEVNQTAYTNIIDPSSSNNLSHLTSDHEVEDHQNVVPSMIDGHYNSTGQSIYQKKENVISFNIIGPLFLLILSFDSYYYFICLFKNCNLTSGALVETLDFGDKSWKCHHCNALFWHAERLVCSGKKTHLLCHVVLTEK